MSDGKKKRIVVIGGGFGGLAFLKAFPSARAEIVLIDKRNHHLFQPLLYQVATTGLAAPDIAQPLRSIFSKRKNVTVLMHQVQSIDLENRKVVTENRKIGYDYLVMAAGGRTSYFGNREWARHAPGLKSLGDARTIRNNILEAYERAERGDCDKEELTRLMTTVVVGAGPTGVEMAGALAELANRILPGDFRNISTRESRILLVEGLDQVLPPFSEKLGKSARRQLEQLGVEVVLGKKVRDIRPETVEFEDGEVVRAANIIWTAGISASPLTEKIDVPKDKAGRLKVNKDCSLPGHPNVFAIGDMAALEDANGTQVPGVAQGAIQPGKHVARLISEELMGNTDRKPFVYKNRGEMATIGRKRAVANMKGKEFSGFAAWLLWLAIHLVALVGMRNRLIVFFNWIYAYLCFQPGARVIWEPNHDE